MSPWKMKRKDAELGIVLIWWISLETPQVSLNFNFTSNFTSPSPPHPSLPPAEYPLVMQLRLSPWFLSPSPQVSTPFPDRLVPLQENCFQKQDWLETVSWHLALSKAGCCLKAVVSISLHC